MEMFSLAEMEMLYKKAQRHLGTGQMMPIEHIYRDKSEEYFAEIEARSQKHNGGSTQLIMKSCEKDLSGHPQCPLIVAQMEGLYFSAFVLANGIISPTSYFGDHRISVSADYLLQPERYSLFFADFYCARYTGNAHYIVLVLAERGSVQEQFCQAHLIKLDMRNNPFLYMKQGGGNKRQQCFVVKNGSDHVFLFHAADFNISECHAASKCTFSRVQLLVNKANSNKLAIGHVYDDRCLVCAIRGVNKDNINNKKEKHNAFVAKMNSMSLGTSSSSIRSWTNVVRGGEAGGWRLWHFDNPDFPEHCARCKSSIRNMIERNGNNPNCKFCTLVEAVFRQMEKEKPNQQQFGTPERWADYLKPAGRVYHNHELSVQIISNWRPSVMAKQISLVRQIGIGLFRDGIVPDCDHSSFHGGGYFCIFMFTTTGDSLQLDQYDRIFDSFVTLALHGAVLLPDHLLEEVSGIYVRARTDLGHLCDDQYGNINMGDLPCKFIFELWIRDRAQLKAFWPALRKWTTEQKEQHGLSAAASFKFRK